MKAPLTPEDKKSLRYECRPGILFGVGIFTFGLLIAYVSFMVSADSGVHDIYLELFITILILLIISSIIILIFIRKYWLDIKNEEKDIMKFIIQKKEAKMDYVDVNPNPKSDQEIEFYDHYHLIIDNNIQEVDKELFNLANIGDEVTMHTAPISGHLLKIELLK